METCRRHVRVDELWDQHSHPPARGRPAERHWHKTQDEFVYVIAGTVTVMSNAGETPVNAGHCTGFKAGVADRHMLENKGTGVVTYLCVGDRSNPEHVTYPDVDMQLVSDKNSPRFLHNDGMPYPEEH
ncbi:MAG: cupin domain-containing protein [Rhodospirillaceae bacterium]|nr:cupin domain-containing protein [Rhodospirillaceae bacterium]